MNTTWSPLSILTHPIRDASTDTLNHSWAASQFSKDPITEAAKQRTRKHREQIKRCCRSAVDFFNRAWRNDAAQDIAEYAVMLAAILVIVIGTIRLVGSNANSVFSAAASSIQ
jgi:Flp pilus assembly pilin Flp